MDAIPDWLLITLGILADLAMLYGAVRLVGRWRRRRSKASKDRTGSFDGR